tara:strand:+ start:76 stop:627 length:552 start_codon:yes stop_codon:yes gene_type:complete
MILAIDKKLHSNLFTAFFIVLVFLFAGCSDSSEEDQEESAEIGSQMGNAVTKNGYDYSKHVVTATVTPYQRGFKVLFSPVSEHFVCATDDYVIQNRNQYLFERIADTKSDYAEGSRGRSDYYDGYIESGAFDGCGYYQVDTTWVIIANRIGIDSNTSYQVVLDDVETGGYGSTPETFNITPSQ